MFSTWRETTRLCTNGSLSWRQNFEGTSAMPSMSPTPTNWDSCNGSAAADHTSWCRQQDVQWSIPWIQGTWLSWTCPRGLRNSVVIHYRISLKNLTFVGAMFLLIFVCSRLISQVVMFCTKLSNSMILIILLLKYIASMLVDEFSIPLHFNLWKVTQEWAVLLIVPMFYC